MQLFRRPSGLLAAISLAVSAGCRSHSASHPVLREPAPASDAAGAADRPSIVAWSQGPFASAMVEPGDLAGVVVDAETGRPISLVQVGIIAPGGPALTDSSGRFRLRLPNAPATVHVRRIGYEALTVPVVPRGDSGLAVVFALRPALVTVCRVSVLPAPMEITSDGRRIMIQPRVERYPGVVVTIRDALTGRAPPGVVTVSVRDGAFTDSVVARSDSGDRAVAITALDRPGRYDVTVRSGGYGEWTGSASTRIASECGGELVPAVFHVWLIPR